jgi:enoyl-CoA hydratase
MEGTVSVEKQGHVLRIGLERPQKMNAFDRKMYRDLAAAYGELQDDDDIRCAVLFGHGEHFTGGLELTDWTETFGDAKFAQLPEGGYDPLRLEGPTITKPVVVAVHGWCLTIGIELLLACDIRIAAKNTRFAQIEVKRGIYPVGGATVRLPREIGWGNAQRYLLTGDEFSGDEAYRMGLVQEITEPGEQFDRALAIAERIAEQAPLGVYASLNSSRVSRQDGEKVALASLMTDLQPLLKSEDVKEGVQSFVERRKAVFKGR